jgi:nucleotide-binding universal stress UspA family protein
MGDSHGDAIWRRSPSRRYGAHDRDGSSTTIVVGVTTSQTSLRALAFAVGLARRQGAELVCVYVPSRGSISIAARGDTGLLAAAAWMRVQLEIEQSLRRQFAADLSAWGAQGHFIVRRGSLRSELRKAAVQWSADATIIGAPAGLRRYLYPVFPYSLVFRGHCPVVMVP